MGFKGIIYKATNIVNGKCYIGQTIRKLQLRINSHFCLTDKNDGITFHNAIKKYGKESFKWEKIS